MEKGEIQELVTAKKLLDDELISNDEFEIIKTRIIKGKTDRLPLYQEGFKWFKFLLIFVVALVVLIYAREPLSVWIKNAAEIKFGQFSLKIYQEARKFGSPELAEKLSGLSEDAVIEFLHTGYDRRYLIVHGSGSESHLVHMADGMPGIIELIDKNLMQTRIPYKDVMELFQKKYQSRRIIYMSKNDPGATMDSVNSEFNIPFERFIIDLNRLNPKERKMIDDFDGELTEEGLKALKILIKTVSKNI
jgi:hypothetical protein